jgi:HAD superfamily hydrolase (TIGR01509 family)
MMRALQAIIFDFDGVIADSERVHLRAYQDTLAPLGLSMSAEDYFARYVGYDDTGSLRKYARDHGLAWSDEFMARLIDAKSQRYEELASHGEMLFPGAAAFVRAAAAEVPIAISSGALTHEIEEVLKRTDLRPLFTTIVGADQTMRSKPSPDPYLEAFERLKRAHPHNAIHETATVAIEDSQWGLVSAATAGLRTVGVANTYAPDALSQYAELVASGLDALTLEALDALCERPARRVSTGAGRSR